jgi:hypothetical protein
MDSKSCDIGTSMPCSFALVISAARSDVLHALDHTATRSTCRRESIGGFHDAVRTEVSVWSNTTVFSKRASSRRRSRTNRPFRAPIVVEMAVTSGMARPSAGTGDHEHGHYALVVKLHGRPEWQTMAVRRRGDGDDREVERRPVRQGLGAQRDVGPARRAA